MREKKLRDKEEWVQGRYGVRSRVLGDEGREGRGGEVKRLCRDVERAEERELKREEGGRVRAKKNRKNEERRKIARSLEKLDEWMKGRKATTWKDVGVMKRNFLVRVEGMTKEAADKKMEREERNKKGEGKVEEEWWKKKVKEWRKERCVGEKEEEESGDWRRKGKKKEKVGMVEEERSVAVEIDKLWQKEKEGSKRGTWLKMLSRCKIEEIGNERRDEEGLSEEGMNSFGGDGGKDSVDNSGWELAAGRSKRMGKGSDAE